MNSKKGFTLVELVVVIGILAVLATIAIPVISNVVNSATLGSIFANARAIELSINSARADIAYKNRETYGDGASNGTVTVGEVIKANSLQDACKRRVYKGREIVPVWNADNGKVVVVYADTYEDVESGSVISRYLDIDDTQTTLIKNLPES